LVRAQLSSARTVADLAPHADSLAALAGQTTSAAVEAAALQLEVEQLRQLDDSARPGVPQGDLRLFLGAESARDSIHAPLLAAALFRRLADEWPASPYAPKALLAAQRLDPADPDAVHERLDSLYHDSPYLALMRGEEAAGYRQLEDSLQTFAAAQPVLAPRRGGPGRLPGQTPRPGQPIPDEDRMRPRRSTPPTGQAVPQEDLARPRRPLPPPADSASTRRRGVEQ
jgi:hypothetical protein